MYCQLNKREVDKAECLDCNHCEMKCSYIISWGERNLSLDCGKTDCDWYDNAKGYEECAVCTRFSKHFSGSLATDRYVVKLVDSCQEE